MWGAPLGRCGPRAAIVLPRAALGPTASSAARWTHACPSCFSGWGFPHPHNQSARSEHPTCGGGENPISRNNSTSSGFLLSCTFCFCYLWLLPRPQKKVVCKCEFSKSCLVCWSMQVRRQLGQLINWGIANEKKPRRAAAWASESLFFLQLWRPKGVGLSAKETGTPRIAKTHTHTHRSLGLKIIGFIRCSFHFSVPGIRSEPQETSHPTVKKTPIPQLGPQNNCLFFGVHSILSSQGGSV